VSTTIATAAGTGLGTERQVFQARNSGLWIAFGFTGTNVLACWTSSDNVTWTAGATHTLGHNHNSEARNLLVAYDLHGSLDVFQVVYVIDVNNAPAAFTIRATLSGGTLTWHASETTIGSTFFTITAPAFSGGAVVFDSSHRVAVIEGALVDQDVDFVRSTAADPGTAESATPVSWTAVSTIDSTMTNETKSAYLVDTSAITSTNHLLVVADNGSADATATALRTAVYDGSAWGAFTNNASGGVVSAFDKNDWGAVEYNGTCHVVRRSGSNTYVHRIWDGTAWSAGSAVPVQASVAGGGVALATDGQSVWLVVIDSGAGSHIRYVQWSPASLNGVADAWGTWADVEAVTSSPSRVGCARDAAKGTLLVYWTEGSSIVAAAPPAPPPPDPPGQVFRDIIVPAIIGTASSATQTITFTGTQPTPGVHKIRAVFGASFTTTPSLTSVKDNATDVAGGHTYSTIGSRIRANAQGDWEVYLDLPVGATWSGNYVITATFSAALPECSQGAIAYRGMQLGAPVATNNNGGSGTAATTGSVTPTATPATYTASLITNTGNNPGTFTWGAPFLEQASQKNGSAGEGLSIADALNDSAANRNAAITVDSTNWDGVIAVWLGLPGDGPQPQQSRGPRFRLPTLVQGRLAAAPAPAAPATGIVLQGQSGPRLQFPRAGQVPFGGPFQVAATDAATGADSASVQQFPDVGYRPPTPGPLFRAGLTGQVPLGGGTGPTSIAAADAATGADSASVVQFPDAGYRAPSPGPLFRVGQVGQAPLPGGLTPLSAADVAAGADAAMLLGLAAADSGAATEAASLVGLADVDVAAGADAATQVALAGSDVAAGGDSAAVTQFPDAGYRAPNPGPRFRPAQQGQLPLTSAGGPFLVSATDAATGADSASITASLTAADTAGGADAVGLVGLGTLGELIDAGTGADAPALLGLSAGELAAALDAIGLVGINAADAGSAADGGTALSLGAAAQALLLPSWQRGPRFPLVIVGALPLGSTGGAGIALAAALVDVEPRTALSSARSSLAVDDLEGRTSLSSARGTGSVDDVEPTSSRSTKVRGQ
jgi:hypothetical protein